VKYGPVTSNRIFSRKNRGLLIRERFAAQTLRHNGVFFGLFHAPVASQIFQRPEKNRLVLGRLRAHRFASPPHDGFAIVEENGVN
jgi:hypothetical protein